MLGQSLSYTVDADDRLTSADAGYFSFALQNLWFGAHGSLGRPLWDFVSGPKVQEVQRSLLAWVRDTGRPVELPFRCDAPALRREMTIVIAPHGSDGDVTFSTRVDHEAIRPTQALLDPRLRHREGVVEMCSWCDRFRTDGQWLELELATRAREMTHGYEVPRIAHGLCDTCAERLATT